MNDCDINRFTIHHNKNFHANMDIQVRVSYGFKTGSAD